LLERTLDDSANRRIILPEAFLAVDEMLKTAIEIFADLSVDEHALTRNLEHYGPFAATERILMAAVKAGADRQVIHELIRSLSMQAWKVNQSGKDNPLEGLLSNDDEIAKYLSSDQVHSLMDYKSHLGDAPKRALKLTDLIKKELKIKAEAR